MKKIIPIISICIILLSSCHYPTGPEDKPELTIDDGFYMVNKTESGYIVSCGYVFSYNVKNKSCTLTGYSLQIDSKVYTKNYFLHIAPEDHKYPIINDVNMNTEPTANPVVELYAYYIDDLGISRDLTARYTLPEKKL